MKTAFAFLAVAGAAMAQSLTDLPQCGQMCIQNMITIASNEFGCAVGDATCYCSSADFAYGLRDCSKEACGSDVSNQVIAFGTNYCKSALASAGSSASAGAASTGALSVLTSALATVTTTGAGGASEASSTPVSTSALVGTITNSDGSTQLTTTGFSTIYGPVGGAAASSALASASASAGSALASISGSAGSALASASASAASAFSSFAASVSGAESSLASAASSAAASVKSGASSAASSAASAASSAAASSTGGSTGAAPMMTAFPMAGAAGIAALLLI